MGTRYIRSEQTQAEKDLLSMSEEQWKAYNDLFVPIEDIWLESIKPVSEGERQRVAGRMAAEAAGTLGPQEYQTRQELFSQGISPGSGLFLSSLSDMAGRRASATTDAVNQGVNAADMDYYQKAILAGKFGLGLAQEGISGLYSGSAAEAAAKRLGEASKQNAKLTDLQNQMGWLNIIGTGLGLATGYGLSKYKTPTSMEGEVTIQSPGGTPYNYNLNAPTGLGH